MLNQINNSIGINQNLNFKSRQSILSKTIDWNTAMLYVKEKDAQTPIGIALRELSTARQKKDSIIERITASLGISKDSNINDIINTIFEAFESQKISERKCFKNIQSVNKANDDYQRAVLNLDIATNERRKQNVPIKLLEDVEKMRQALLKISKNQKD